MQWLAAEGELDRAEAEGQLKALETEVDGQTNPVAPTSVGFVALIPTVDVRRVGDQVGERFDVDVRRRARRIGGILPERQYGSLRFAWRLCNRDHGRVVQFGN